MNSPQPPDYFRLAQELSVATNPYRLQILHELAARPASTQELDAILGITKSAVSQHLSVLRLLGFVDSRRVGYTMVHTLRRDHEFIVRLEKALPEIFRAA